MASILTKKQQRVFDFIKNQVDQSGYPPTIREIAGSLQLAGPNSAKKFLDILERKGFIKRRPGCPRAIELQERPHSSVRLVPVMGSIRAGKPDFAFEDIQESIAVDPSIARGTELFFLQVKGDSMIGAHILDGDLALIRRQPEVSQGEIAAVLIGEEATLKYFYKEKSGIRLQAANQAYEPIFIKEKTTEEASILGKLVGLVRRME